MWNDFFIDAGTDLKEREIFPIEPDSTPVFFNLFAAIEPSAKICIAHGTLCNDPGVYIATTTQNCGCEFRPRQARSVRAEPLAVHNNVESDFTF